MLIESIIDYLREQETFSIILQLILTVSFLTPIYWYYLGMYDNLFDVCLLMAGVHCLLLIAVTLVALARLAFMAFQRYMLATTRALIRLVVKMMNLTIPLIHQTIVDHLMIVHQALE